MKRHSHSFCKPCTFFHSTETVSSITPRPQLDLIIFDECDKIDVDSLEESANREDVEAQLQLADCYYYGRGISKKRGGRIKQDVNTAFTWWSKAAEHNNAKAQCCLGYCYWYGEGVSEKEKEKKSFDWYQKASEQGEMVAQYCLAYFYLCGVIVEKNKEEAMRLYRASAEQGYPLALRRLKELEDQI